MVRLLSGNQNRLESELIMEIRINYITLSVVIKIIMSCVVINVHFILKSGIGMSHIIIY